MTAFDITPLQIPVADPSMVVGHHSHHFHSLPRPQKVPSNCEWIFVVDQTATWLTKCFCCRRSHGKCDTESGEDVGQCREFHRRPQNEGGWWPLGPTLRWPQKLRLWGRRIDSWIVVFLRIRYTMIELFSGLLCTYFCLFSTILLVKSLLMCLCSLFSPTAFTLHHHVMKCAHFCYSKMAILKTMTLVHFRRRRKYSSRSAQEALFAPQGRGRPHQSLKNGHAPSTVRLVWNRLF